MRVRTRVSRVMRQSMSGAELRIWARIRGRRLDGWKFRRQHPIGPYYVDFFCPAARLVVEVDGPSHWLDFVGAYDERRQAWLEAMGLPRAPNSSRGDRPRRPQRDRVDRGGPGGSGTTRIRPEAPPSP